MKQLSFIRTAILISLILTFVLGSLLVGLKPVSATSESITPVVDQPTMYLLYLGTTGNTWEHTVVANPGQSIWFYAEITNTEDFSQAQNLHIRATLPQGVVRGGSAPETAGPTQSTAYVYGDFSPMRNKADSVTVNVTGNGGELIYVPGSTRMTWDTNGDGVYEYNNTPMADGITEGGLVLGNQNWGDRHTIQISYQVNVQGAPSPSPTPSPTPSPSPSPSPSPTPTPSPTPSPSPSPSPVGGVQCPSGYTATVVGSTILCIQNSNTNGNTNTNNQNQTQNNNQTVNVLGAKLTTQPETGVGVLGMAAMFGAAPAGLILSRYGRGRISSKKQESLMEIANGLVEIRNKR